MKVLFIIPDGVGIRNYLYSDVLKYIKDKAEIVFWSKLPEAAFDEVKRLHNINIKINALTLHKEAFVTRLYREAAAYARLKYNAKQTGNNTILTYWYKKGKNFKIRLLLETAQVLGSLLNSYASILAIEKRQERSWSKEIINKYKEKLLIEKPDCIFITHQRVAELLPLCLAAQQLNISVISAIYSWDNLPKARLAVKADTYILWSQLMYDEMRLFYPHIETKKLEISGTPQFDFYKHNNRIVSREFFAEKYGLNISKKWICFSGNDRLTSPDDPAYLSDVISAIKMLPADEQPEIVFRRSPADFSDRFNNVLEQNRRIIKSIDPEWNTSGNNWGAFFPKLSDVDLLVNLTWHCALVINLGSTMGHDFSVFNKPCLYIRYNQPNSKALPVEVCYQYQHFRSMDGLDAVGFVYTPDEWNTKIMEALQTPEKVGKDRRIWFEKVVRTPIEENSLLIANKILEV